MDGKRSKIIILHDCLYTRIRWSESGVRWFLYRSINHFGCQAGIALLERGDHVGSKRNATNGALSFAEKLLERQKQHAGRSEEATDEEWMNNTPHVHELLTRVLVDNKKILEPATLLIFARSGSWHALINHKGLKLKWWSEGPTITGALVALERVVRQEMGQDASESGEVSRNRS